MYDDFPNSLYDSTSPGLFVHIYEKNLNDHTVMIVEVPFNAKRPVYIIKEGMITMTRSPQKPHQVIYHLTCYQNAMAPTIATKNY